MSERKKLNKLEKKIKNFLAHFGSIFVICSLFPLFFLFHHFFECGCFWGCKSWEGEGERERESLCSTFIIFLLPKKKVLGKCFESSFVLWLILFEFCHHFSKAHQESSICEYSSDSLHSTLFYFIRVFWFLSRPFSLSHSPSFLLSPLSYSLLFAHFLAQILERKNKKKSAATFKSFLAF